MDIMDVVLGGAFASGSGGSGGTSDYSALTNKPQINSHTLNGNVDPSTLGITYDDLADKPFYTETGLSYEMPDDKTGLEYESLEVSGVTVYFYKIAEALGKAVFRTMKMDLFAGETQTFNISDLYVVADGDSEFCLSSNDSNAFPLCANVVEDGASFELMGFELGFEKAGLYAVYMVVDEGPAYCAKIYSDDVVHQLSSKYVPDNDFVVTLSTSDGTTFTSTTTYGEVVNAKLAKKRVMLEYPDNYVSDILSVFGNTTNGASIVYGMNSGYVVKQISSEQMTDTVSITIAS